MNEVIIKKTYHKFIVIKKVWFWQMERRYIRGAWEFESVSFAYLPTDFDNGVKTVQLRTESFLEKAV